MADSKLAAPELAAFEIHSMTRASFILRGAMTAGAVYGASAVAPFVSQAVAQGGGGDVDILNFALTLEYLETEFYTVKGKSVGLSGEAKSLAATIGDHEAQHVQALTSAIKAAGGTPAAKPKFAFPVTGQASFLKLAHTLEETGVSAYNGAGPQLSNPQYLAAAGSIVQVEARHAAAIALLIGKSPAPLAFDKPKSKAQVLAAAGPLIKK
ncbi:MAG TPA: ferritin-like domain-containing protein [Solirubrobacteraceae bacterium]|jgi:hypothetical protein|nr:ferritin-like domain-containing protein [Solirubrobacteraceae bacterium]